MAYQGEHFVQRYGAGAAVDAPPIRRMLEAGVPVGAGTDATRVASYNPWVGLYWLVTGRTIGGLDLTPGGSRLDRTAALRLWTEGSAWFSDEQEKKGRIAPGRFADLAVLDADYFSVPDASIKSIASALTMVAGRVVHGDLEFKDLAPPLPPALPDWSPVRRYAGFHRSGLTSSQASACAVHRHAPHPVHAPVRFDDRAGFFGALGCNCFVC
jgi:hypothetical protein